MSDVSVEEALQIGLNYHQAGNLPEAENIYQQILEAFPQVSDAWNLLGLIEAAKENYANARDLIQKAIVLNPEIALYHTNLGEILRKLGDYENSEETLKQAVSLNPSDPNAHFNLANVYKYREKYELAEASYKSAIELNASDQDYYFNLGNMYKDLLRFEEAKAVYEKALQIKGAVHILNHYAQLLVLMGEYQSAIDIYHHILLSTGDDKNIYFNLGNAYREQGDLNMAIENFRRAINVDRTFTPAHLNLSFVLLKQKAYKEAWQEYQWRLKAPDSNYLDLDKIYEGGEWRGKKVLVFHEQGYGDTIMMSRFLPQLAFKTEACYFLPQKELQDLFTDSFENITLVNKDALPEYDLAVHINTLPYMLDIDADSKLQTGFMIQLNEAKAYTYKERYFSTDKTKVGIVWKSTNVAYDAHLKSAMLEDFQSLIVTDSVQVYSLQKDGSDELTGTTNVINLDSELKDFSDTAALLANLDVLITIDTSVVHLAGMMGIPMHVLLHEKAEWRWGEGDTTPWYPDVKLYRCTKELGFKTLVDTVVQRLK